jgi:hypothetical protein
MTIDHLATPAHVIDYLDGIYRSVEALIDSIEEGDSTIAVALHDEDQCAHCFRQAVLHVIELLPHCEDTAAAVDMAHENHLRCLEEGLLPGNRHPDRHPHNDESTSRKGTP